MQIAHESRRWPARVMGFALVVVSLACSQSKNDPPAETPPPPPAKVDKPASASPVTWYRVEVIADAASSVPFFLGVYDKVDRVVIDNGEEQLEAVLVGRTPLRVRMPVLGGEVTLAPNGTTGSFRGDWTAKTLIKEPFRVEAQRVDAPSPHIRFPGDDPPGASIAGVWRVELADFGIGRAVFRQDDAGNLSGAVIPPDVGDTRYLSGRVIGDRFVMSTFDGMHAHLVEGTIEDGGKRLRGRWVAAGFGEWTFTATQHDPPAALSLMRVRLKKGRTRVTVAGLEKPPYKGEPVVVEYFGTWCSACMDLMPEILSLEKRYSGRGLKLLLIALEPAGDEADGKRRIEEVRKKYGLTRDIDVRFAEDLLADIPPEIDNALGFPLTIFVRRDGTVAGINSAFISQAAAADHATMTDHFEAMAKEIVESGAGSKSPPKASKSPK